MLKRMLIGFVVIMGGLMAFAATRPGTYHVERAQKIEAPAAVVFGQLDNFKAWGAWSPWDKLDPKMTKTYEGPERGVGAGYSWKGNDKVGKGKMTITESQPPSSVKYRLEFIEPFAAVAATGMTLTPDGDQAVNVKWEMDGTNNFVGKVFSIFMNMDDAIGADFETGLKGLQAVAEAEAKKVAEAEAAAAAAAKLKAEAEAAAKVAVEADAAKAAEESAAASKGKGNKK